MTLGERIKELRKKHRLTQVELAQKLDVTKGTVSTWETNSRTPNFDTLEQMCDLFQVGMDYLLGRSDDASPIVKTEEDTEALGRFAVEDDLTEYAVKYARLDEFGRQAVESLILAEFNRCRMQKTLQEAGTYSASIRIKNSQ